EVPVAVEDAVLDKIENIVQTQIETAISGLVQEQIEPMKKEMRKTSLLLENNVLPRLQNIESCYTTTYRRYVEGIGQIETMQNDIAVLKDVVAEHSVILKKIS
ncbi:MAG: hypothetical protein LUE19_08265, partial [Clostridiales bacterium]|nr:hypothetical protein [Clostridiales bacterium]